MRSQSPVCWRSACWAFHENQESSWPCWCHISAHLLSWHHPTPLQRPSAPPSSPKNSLKGNFTAVWVYKLLKVNAWVQCLCRNLFGHVLWYLFFFFLTLLASSVEEKVFAVTSFFAWDCTGPNMSTPISHQTKASRQVQLTAEGFKRLNPWILAMAEQRGKGKRLAEVRQPPPGSVPHGLTPVPANSGHTSVGHRQPGKPGGSSKEQPWLGGCRPCVNCSMGHVETGERQGRGTERFWQSAIYSNGGRKGRATVHGATGGKSLEESAWRRGGSRDEEGENRGPYSEEAKAQNNLGVVTTQGGHSEKQAEGKGEALIPTGGSQGFTSNSSTAASHTLPCEDNDISTEKPVLP